MATKSFFNLERKLTLNKDLAKQYYDFMSEYLELGHMEQVEKDRIGSTNYYLPHHAVIKDSSVATKTRVVFDASGVTSKGLSLNDIMLRGPIVQSSLFSTLLRFI